MDLYRHGSVGDAPSGRGQHAPKAAAPFQPHARCAQSEHATVAVPKDKPMPASNARPNEPPFRNACSNRTPSGETCIRRLATYEGCPGVTLCPYCLRVLAADFKLCEKARPPERSQWLLSKRSSRRASRTRKTPTRRPSSS